MFFTKVFFLALVIVQISTLKFGRGMSPAFPYRPLSMEPSWDILYRICGTPNIGKDDGPFSYKHACYGCFNHAYKYQTERNEAVMDCHEKYLEKTTYNKCLEYLQQNATTCEYDKCMVIENSKIIMKECMTSNECNTENTDYLNCIFEKISSDIEKIELEQYGNNLVIFPTEDGIIAARQNEIFKYNCKIY